MTMQLGVEILKEISSLTTELVGASMVDSQNFVAVTKHAGRVWRVAQPGADMSIALKKVPYAQIYADLAATNNYALRMLDGALIQFSYEGIGRSIERHRLAYLPAPDLEPYQNDPELYFGEQHFVDIVGHQVMPVPVRFDFDARPESVEDVVHPVSHVTFGQYQHCRVPVTRAVAPSEFLSFILSSFYSTPDHPYGRFDSRVVLGEPTITEAESGYAHVALP